MSGFSFIAFTLCHFNLSASVVLHSRAVTDLAQTLLCMGYGEIDALTIVFEYSFIAGVMKTTLPVWFPSCYVSAVLCVAVICPVGWFISTQLL